MRRRTWLLLAVLFAAILLEVFIQMRPAPTAKAGDGRLFCAGNTVARIVDNQWVCWNPNSAKPWWHG